MYSQYFFCFQRFNFLPALLAGGAALGGGIMDFFSQQNTNATQVAIANKQMKFQKQMASTQYQRQAKDMAKAGLNPILAAGGGGGAASPSGASAQLSAPQIGDALGKTVSSAIEARRLEKEIDSVDSQTKLNEANKLVADQQRILTQNNARTAKANAQAAEAELPVTKARAHFDEKAQPYDSVMQRLGTATGAIGNALGAAARGVFKGAAGSKGPKPGSYEHYKKFQYPLDRKRVFGR